FEPPERFVAGTVGPPGERTFFLQARGGGRLVSVALEKVQVALLAEKLDELLVEANRRFGVELPPTDDAPGDNEPLDTPLDEEFRVGTLGLAFDVDTATVVIEAIAAGEGEEAEEEEDDEEAVSADRDRLRVRGERPLWDFPDGTLAGREVAAYELSAGAGFDLVPPTVLRDGPLGTGMCQLWIDEECQDEPLLGFVRARRIPPGWHRIASARDDGGRPYALARDVVPGP